MYVKSRVHKWDKMNDGCLSDFDLIHLVQFFLNLPMLWPFNKVPYIVVIPDHKIIFITTL